MEMISAFVPLYDENQAATNAFSSQRNNNEELGVSLYIKFMETAVNRTPKYIHP